MDKSHVFLFPSLFEGFGQVILESMSRSLPTITTINTCGIDIIKDKNGYLTNIGDIEYTREILNTLYDNEDLRLSIAENSYFNSKNYTWQLYEKLKEIVYKLNLIKKSFRNSVMKNILYFFVYMI